MDNYGIIFTFLTNYIAGVVAATSKCSYGDGFMDFEYCFDGCCGTTEGNVCCPDESFDDFSKTGMIVGISFGCLVAIFMGIGMICFCAAAKGRRWRLSPMVFQGTHQSRHVYPPVFVTQNATVGTNGPAGFVPPGQNGNVGPPRTHGPPRYQGPSGMHRPPELQAPPNPSTQNAYPPAPYPNNPSGFTYSSGTEQKKVPTAPPPSYDAIAGPPAPAVYNSSQH